MEQHTSIQGPQTLPDDLNFRILKSIGLDTIIQTGSQQWTDYNEHDPGITILENLSLAVTDLSYRTTFPIEDILSIKTNNSNQHQFYPDQFHTAANILTTSPITANDLRKSLCDIKDIDNAWVKPLTLQDTPFKGLYDLILNPSEDLQAVTEPYHLFITELTDNQTNILTANLNILRKIPSGKTVLITKEFTTLLAYLWNISPSLIEQLEDSLNAFFAVIPELLPEFIIHLEVFEQPQTPHSNSREQRKNSLSKLLHKLFFNSRITDDQWIPIGLRTVLERIFNATTKHQFIINQIKSCCSSSRLLSQDLNQIILREPIKVLFDLDFTLSPEAIPENTIADILIKLKSYLSETINFISLDEMNERHNGDVNATFNGPSLSHGFIDDKSLSPLRYSLNSSDLSNLALHTPGVLQVNRLRFALTSKGTTPGVSEWTDQLIIPIQFLSVLGPIDNNIYSTHIDKKELSKQFESKLHSIQAAKLTPKIRDLPIPTGKYRNPSYYNSIQEDFPRLYELQPHGPASPTPTRSRIGEIHQLQAYLLIFDQILADYLEQLANIGQLYSWSTEVTSTRFFKGLENTVHQLSDLVDIKEYNKLTPLFRESQEVFVNRRNTFLKKMLSRLGRDLSSDLNSLYPNPNQAHLQLEQSRKILASYDTLSSGRGTGNHFETHQPSGLAQWIYDLLGFKTLSHQDKLFLAMFSQADLKDLATSIPWMPLYSLSTQDNTPLDFKQIMLLGQNPKNYKLDRNNQPISPEEEKLWFSWKLTPYSLKKDENLANLPSQGKEQIIVSKYKGTYIFRIFNQDAICSLNLTSLQLTDVYYPLQELDKLLLPYWENSNIPNETEHEIIDLIVYIVQFTHRLVLSGPLSDGSYSKPCQLNQAFSGDDTSKPVIDNIIELLKRYDKLSEQLTVVEHTLLRPSPEKLSYHISLLDKNDQIWATSKANSKLSSLQQISPEGQQSIHWQTICTSTNSTSNYITSCSPPYTVVKQSTVTESPHINFSVIEDNGVNIEITYGTQDNLVQLVSTKSFDSEESALETIKDWMCSMASQQNNEQLSWITQLSSDELTSIRETTSLPSYIQSDPYSFVTTVVLPDWPTRFQDSAFKENLERIIRQESPSHLFINIIWVEHSWHQKFKDLYTTWLEVYNDSETRSSTLSSISKPLLEMILQRSYPRSK